MNVISPEEKSFNTSSAEHSKRITLLALKNNSHNLLWDKEIIKSALREFVDTKLDGSPNKFKESDYNTVFKLAGNERITLRELVDRLCEDYLRDQITINQIQQKDEYSFREIFELCVLSTRGGISFSSKKYELSKQNGVEEILECFAKIHLQGDSRRLHELFSKNIDKIINTGERSSKLTFFQIAEHYSRIISSDSLDLYIGNTKMGAK